MILKANGFAIVKYNGLFSIFVLFALPGASDALKGPCRLSTKLPSLYTYYPVCPLGLCYSFSVSLSDFCWALFHMGISKFLPITAVYNFFCRIFPVPSYPSQASDIFLFSEDFQVYPVTLLNCKYEFAPAVHLDLEALQTQELNLFPLLYFHLSPSPTPRSDYSLHGNWSDFFFFKA